MKKIFFVKTAAVVYAALFLFYGCKKSSGEESLAGAGIGAEQTVYTLRNSDIEAGFTVTTDEPASSDMIFALTATGSADGMYVLNQKSLTVNAGERTASGSVIFLASQFTVATPDLSLRISARCASAEMYDDASFVDFKVTFEPIVAEIAASESSVTVNEEDVTVVFSVKLSRAAAEDLAFAIVDTGAGANAQGSYAIPDQGNGVTVLQGMTEATGEVRFNSEWFSQHPDAVVNLSLQITTESLKVAIPENPTNPDENQNVVVTAKGPDAP